MATPPLSTPRSPFRRVCRSGGRVFGGSTRSDPRSDRPERRRTWAPNSSLMTFRTRFQVQTSPRNPKCSGPSSKREGSFSVRSSSESFGGRPGLGSVLSASLPPSRAFFIQWLTELSLAPSASATRGLSPAFLFQFKRTETTGFAPIRGIRVHGGKRFYQQAPSES